MTRIEEVGADEEAAGAAAVECLPFSSAEEGKEVEESVDDVVPGAGGQPEDEEAAAEAAVDGEEAVAAAAEEEASLVVRGRGAGAPSSETLTSSMSSGMLENKSTISAGRVDRE